MSESLQGRRRTLLLSPTGCSFSPLFLVVGPLASFKKKSECVKGPTTVVGNYTRDPNVADERIHIVVLKSPDDAPAREHSFRFLVALVFFSTLVFIFKYCNTIDIYPTTHKNLQITRKIGMSNSFTSLKNHFRHFFHAFTLKIFSSQSPHYPFATIISFQLLAQATTGQSYLLLSRRH